jgi:sugar (pentulose or hexulose) kinase
MEPERFVSHVVATLDQCVSRYCDETVSGIGVTGMAETIFVETSDHDLLPARAWNQQARQEIVLPDPQMFFKSGLLDSARTSAVELRRIADSGTRVVSWSGLPEYAIEALSGVRVAERSLAARSGLVDVMSGDWNPDMLAWANAPEATPDLQSAGTPAGVVTGMQACKGAIVTLAGHDHLVAALGAGANDERKIFNSLGTGEAVLTQISTNANNIDLAVLNRYTSAGFNVGLGVDEQDFVALAGLGTGNRFNLLLHQLSSAGFTRKEVTTLNGTSLTDMMAHNSLRESATDLFESLFHQEWRPLEVSEIAAEFVARYIEDIDSAQKLWWATVERATLRARAAVESLMSLNPRLSELISAGGWLANPSIREMRQLVLGPVKIPSARECGTRGAALLAGLAAGTFSSRAEFPKLK